MQNEMRNRLVELVQDALFQHAHYVGKERRRALEAETEADHSEIYESIKTLHEYVADHLIENGVIVPPCKVGETLYLIQIDYIGNYSMSPIIVSSKITMFSILRAYEEKTIIYMSTDKNKAEQKLQALKGGADNE